MQKKSLLNQQQMSSTFEHPKFGEKKSTESAETGGMAEQGKVLSGGVENVRMSKPTFVIKSEKVETKSVKAKFSDVDADQKSILAAVFSDAANENLDDLDF
jgi:hypothetical protein